MFSDHPCKSRNSEPLPIDLGRGFLYVARMPFGFEDTFNAWPVQSNTATVSPWATANNVSEQPKPDYADDKSLKQMFAIALARGLKPFDAGLEVFNGDTIKALWVSVHWIIDIQVIALRDAYLSSQKTVEKPLDKEQLLARIMAFAEEKDIYGRPLVEAKERLNAYRLYSDISGYTGKIDINASTNNNFVNKTVNLVMVKAGDNKSPMKTIDQSPNVKSEIPNEGAPTIKLKLVGGAG